MDVIDLCSTSSGEEDNDFSSNSICNFSPVKSKTERVNSGSQDGQSDISVDNDPEFVIKSLIPNVNDDNYHDFEQNIPVLSRTRDGLSVLQLFTLMIGSVPADRICCRKPTAVTYSSVFVVDLTCVRCIDDLRADDNGVWVHGGKPRKTYSVEFDGTGSEIVSVTPVDADGQSISHVTNHFTLVRLYHWHKATSEFQRRISYVIDSNGRTVQYAVMQYMFENGIDVPVITPPHGNAKKDLCSFRRTQKSTLTQIKEMPYRPKSVVANLHEEAGGMLSARSASELPRNRRQVYNNHHKVASSHGGGKVDPIFELVQQCKVDNIAGGRGFIRSVNFESGPCCVLASDNQLQNVVRFCTNPRASSVFGIDPTFNLGKFYVTLTTFTYTQVVNKTTSLSPTFLGPVFVHTEKNYESFFHFFSTLLKLESKFNDIIAVGTDGEVAIVQALKANFHGDTVYLRCFIHMRDCIRRKLKEFLIPEQDIEQDIFGLQRGK